MTTIVFQGDSITDAIRTRDNDQFRGSGYATLVSARLMRDHPGKYSCYNRGVSGDRVVDILARMRRDIENLHPDVMSLLIGINDVWHESSSHNGVPQERFERVLDLLVDELLTSMPSLKLIMLEPFVLQGSATASSPERPDRWDYFRTETPLRADAVHNCARKYDLPFVPLQEDFTRLSRETCVEDWLMDGVHPTAAGHQLIADKWLDTFSKL